MTFEPDCTIPCSEPGCDWTVTLPETRCAEHGGSPDAPQFRTTVDDGVEVRGPLFVMTGDG